MINTQRDREREECECDSQEGSYIVCIKSLGCSSLSSECCHQILYVLHTETDMNCLSEREKKEQSQNLQLRFRRTMHVFVYTLITKCELKKI